MNYKLVALDLDGTLLSDDKLISEENINVLRKLNKLGIEILIVTGRRYYSAKQLTKKLCIDLVILANNGNIIRRSSDDKILLYRYIEEEFFRNIIEISKDVGLFPIIHVNHFEEGYDLIIESSNKNNNQYYNINDKRIVKIDDLLNYKGRKALSICYFGEYSVLDNFKNKLIKLNKFNFNHHILTNLNMKESLLEIMNPNGSKWQTLIHYANSRGIKKEEIIAIGDDNNDIEMLKNSGLGIALKNSSLNVKNSCNTISNYTNNESGVGKVLKDIFNI